MKLRNSALLAASALGLASCAANPGPVIDTSTKKLISYFDAKKELADTLQRQLGGGIGPAASDLSNYRLVALNGPAYQLGSVLSARNALDLMTRRCTFGEDNLPIEPWSTMPRWTSDSNLNTDLGIPAPFQGAFNKTSVDADLNFGSVSVYGIDEISQRFLARDELQDLTRSGSCGDFFSELDEPVLFVRGIVYGRETLKSSRSFGAGLDARIIEGESGQCTFRYDRNGAYELTDTEVMPKFAIIAKFVPESEPPPPEEPAPTDDLNEAPLIAPPIRMPASTSTPRPTSPPQPSDTRGDPVGSIDLSSIEPAAGPRPAVSSGITTERLTDEEVAEIEKMLAGGGN